MQRMAAGNSIIVKSSEKSPLGVGAKIHLLLPLTDPPSTQPLFLAGLTVEAGFPPGIIQVISGAGSAGKILAEHMAIRKISFTGSARAGRLGASCSRSVPLKRSNARW